VKSLRRRLILSLAGMFVLGYIFLTAAWFFAGQVYVDNGDWGCFTASPFGSSSCAFVTWNLAVRVVVAVLIAVVLGAIVRSWWFLSSRMIRPLLTTTEVIRRLGPQNLGERIRMTGRASELKELADALDEALDRVAAGYESQRRFASNASHELRTPLAVQRLLTEVAMDNPEASEDLRRLGGLLLSANERNERLIEALLVLAESDRGLTGKTPVRLNELAASVLDEYLEIAAEHNIKLRRDLNERLVPGEQVLLERLIRNLVSNAVTYNRPGGWAEIVVSGEPAITVRNSGQNVPAHAVASLFEPFRRLTADRTDHSRGAGLGLSIVRSITTAHEGRIQARPGTEGGLIVEISLPDVPGRPMWPALDPNAD
jgi:signal transduction histidine kinase